VQYSLFDVFLGIQNSRKNENFTERNQSPLRIGLTHYLRHWNWHTPHL